MRASLADFVGSLDRVRDIATEIDNNVSRALSDARVLQRHQTVQCASTIIVSGYFESFLSDVAEAFIRDLCSKGIPFGSLPLSIRATHFGEGAELLAKMARRETATLKRDPSKQTFADSEGMARRVASVASGAAYELVWEAFAGTRANPGPTSIREFLNRFGIESGWKRLSQEVRLSEATLETVLSGFISVRNECAHSGTATKIPTPSDVRDYCDLLQRVALGITVILESHLAGPGFAAGFP
jgi:HEPN superfamily RiboL-PSP-like protein